MKKMTKKTTTLTVLSKADLLKIKGGGGGGKQFASLNQTQEFRSAAN